MRIIIFVTIAIYFILGAWLFDRYFVVRGVWSVADDFEKSSRLVSAPNPDERVLRITENGDAYYKILQTPVYFDIKTPRRFQKIGLDAAWRGEAPIIEAGLVKSENPWQVDMKTFYNKYLEDLSWPRIAGEGLVLWQRNPVYQSVRDFLNNPPLPVEIITIDAPHLKSKFVLPWQYEFAAADFGRVSTFARSYKVSLRGSQNIFIATASSGLDLHFWVQDLNRHDGADSVTVALRDLSGKTIFTEELTDDGQEWNSTKLSALRELDMSNPDLSPGIYRITFEAGDDIAIREIITSAAKMVFKNQLYLGDEVGYRAGVRSLTVWSNGQGYGLRTPHPDSLQKVQFKSPLLENRKLDLGLELTEYGKQYSLMMPREIAGNLITIMVPKRDLVLNSDGFFALSAEDFFLPEHIQWKADLDLDRLGINYVIADYSFFAEKRDWKTTTLTFSGGQPEDGSPLRIVFGFPVGARSEFEISQLRINGYREGLTPSTIWSKLKGVYARCYNCIGKSGTGNK